MRARTRSAALAVAVLAALALLVEALLRIDRFGPSRAAFGRWKHRIPWEAVRSIDGDGTMRPRPGGWERWALSAGEEVIDYRFDEQGLRAPARGGHLAAPDACRVLVVGDSNAAGYGVPAESAYPARLHDLLAARGVSASVGNGGIFGSDVGHQRRWLETLLPATMPDVVVLTVSPWSMRTDPAPTGYEGRHWSDKLWRVMEARAATLRAYSALADDLWRRGFHALSSLIGWPPDSNVAWEMIPLLEPRTAFARRWEDASRDVERMVQMARRHGAEVLLVFVPLDVQVSTERNELYRAERLPYPSFGFEDRDYTRDERYAEALVPLADGLQIEALDMTEVLRRAGGDVFLERDYHLSPAGSHRIASALVGLVADRCARRARAPQAG